MKITKKSEFSEVGNFTVTTTTYEPDHEHNVDQLYNAIKEMYTGTTVERVCGYRSITITEFHKKPIKLETKVAYFNDKR